VAGDLPGDPGGVADTEALGGGQAAQVTAPLREGVLRPEPGHLGLGRGADRAVGAAEGLDLGQVAGVGVAPQAGGPVGAEPGRGPEGQGGGPGSARRRRVGWGRRARTHRARAAAAHTGSGCRGRRRPPARGWSRRPGRRPGCRWPGRPVGDPGQVVGVPGVDPGGPGGDAGDEGVVGGCRRRAGAAEVSASRPARTHAKMLVMSGPFSPAGCCGCGARSCPGRSGVSAGRAAGTRPSRRQPPRSRLARRTGS
jgi:hypothetical protein